MDYNYTGDKADVEERGGKVLWLEWIELFRPTLSDINLLNGKGGVFVLFQ